MLKKLLILSLFFQLTGFASAALASQEPQSNSWGFGTFLAAGAALGSYIYTRAQHKESVNKVMQDRYKKIAQEAAAKAKEEQELKDFQREHNLSMEGRVVYHAFDSRSKFNLGGTGKFRFLKSDIEKAQTQFVSLSKKNMNELNMLVARNWVFNISNGDGYFYKYYSKIVPLLKHESMVEDALDQVIDVKDVAKLCYAYVYTYQTDRVFVNKSKLMRALSSLPFRGGNLCDLYGLRCDQAYKNLVYKDFELQEKLEITKPHDGCQSIFEEDRVYWEDGRPRYLECCDELYHHQLPSTKKGWLC